MELTALKKKKKFEFPHSYTLIFILIVLSALLTWVVPSGQFDTAVETIDGVEKTVIVPGTYQELDKFSASHDYRQGLFSILEAPSNGLVAAAEVVAFVLVLGGAFGVILKTGAIDRALGALAKYLGNKGILVIPISMILFSLGGSTYGMSEEVIPLYAVFITLMFSLGFDSMTAILILFLGTQTGYVGATINPFSVLIAQGVGGVQGNPLLWLRVIYWVIFTAVSIGFTMWYALKVKKNPESSLSYKTDLSLRKKYQNMTTSDSFSAKDKLIILGFIVCLGTMVWGIMTHGWYMIEIGALFVALGLFAGIVAGFSQKEISESFVAGCADFVYAAVIIGLARGILVILENGMIIDTVLNALTNLLSGLPDFLFTSILLVSQTIISFFVPSSSGAAALTMPVMAPLADLMNTSRDVVVMSNQFGNGLINIISPTGGVLLAGLAISEINYSQWFKVAIKIFAILFVIAAALLYVATLF